MKTYEPEELKNILDKHRKWVMGESGGERANLSSANLRHADLRSANLSSANLSSANLRHADLRSANLRYADLRHADLRSANLSSANLSSANLRHADLRSANLSSANLRSANLSYADLSSADLSYANLSSANFSSAHLRYADLSYADLSYADLRYANLSSANLRHADLALIIEDFYKFLDLAKAEVPTLYKSVWDGKIDGTQYQGECACLVGTIANARHINYENLGDLKPDASRLSEKWFLGIGEGDTPQNSPVSKLTAEWLEKYMEKEGIAVPKRSVIWSLKRTC
jgi:hypothetical protein